MMSSSDLMAGFIRRISASSVSRRCENSCAPALCSAASARCCASLAPLRICWISGDCIRACCSPSGVSRPALRSFASLALAVAVWNALQSSMFSTVLPVNGSLIPALPKTSFSHFARSDASAASIASRCSRSLRAAACWRRVSLSCGCCASPCGASSASGCVSAA